MAPGTIPNNSEMFNLFMDASKIFRGRYQDPYIGKYKIEGPMDAAIMFLGYAFQHAGTNPSYPPAAAEAIKRSKGSEGSEDFPLIVLANFSDLLDHKKLNLKLNPLFHKCWKCCPDLTQTNACNCIWCVLKRDGIDNIVLKCVKDIKDGQTRDAWEQLKKIRGVKNKIASFFLRDIAISNDLTPTNERWLLQPIDIWVRRIVQSLNDDPKMNDEEIAKWIVKTCEDNCINPEQCNQGIWYFGAKIAESDFILKKSLRDVDYARKILKEHLEVLKALASINLSNGSMDSNGAC